MLHEDYLMRMLRPLSAVVATMLQIRKGDLDEEKKGRQFEDALLIVDRTEQQLLGLNSMVINQLAEGSLFEILGLDSPLGASKCLALAYLLKEEGDIFAARGDEAESYRRYIKALNIYFEVLQVKGVAELRDQFPEVNAVIDKVQGYDLPADTQYGLFRYYEVTGSYGKAEDILFDLMDADPDDKDLIDDGIAFFRRLREESDGQLIAGNLPRREVEAGLRELEEKRKA